MTSISISIPFASTDARRRLLFAWTRRRWELLFPDAQLCVGESDPADFNRSAARNHAVAHANGEILLLTDADIACNPEPIRDAIRMVAEGRAPWVVAHDTYYELSESFSDEVLTRQPDSQFQPPYDGPSSTKSEAGVLVVPRAAFERAGGYDERFIGWGYEDNAFAAVLNRVCGQCERVEGDMLHLWHEPGLRMNQPHIEHNRSLYRAVAE